MACALFFARSGRQADSLELEASLSCLDHRGPDGRDFVSKGPFTAAFLHFWTTPEDLRHRQPVSFADGRYWLFFDGRLDGRDELASSLDVDVGRDDATIVARAYARWGMECWSRVIGPYVAVVVDHFEQHLVMVRDPIGDRTLFYNLTPGMLLVASEESAVLAHPAVERSLDQDAVDRYLLGLELVDDSTLFRSVRELRPAETIRVDRQSVHRDRFWRAVDVPPLRYRRDEEYADHFREVLEQAVGDRLRSTTAPVLQLSGGLDSTAIAAVASSRSESPLRTATWVFDDEPSCDERSWIDDTVRELGIEHRLVIADSAPAFHDFERWPHNPNVPEDSPFRPLVEAMYETVTSWDSRVMLTGLWGDNVFLGGAGWWYALLADRKWGEATRAARERIHESGMWPFLRRDLLAPLIARWRWTPESWSAAARQLTLVQPKASDTWPLAGANPRTQRRILRVVSLINARATVSELYHLRRHRLDIRNPFRDRRLVELSLGLPEYQLRRGGLSKYVLRKAMCGMMPRSVVERRDKTSFHAHFMKGLLCSSEALEKRLMESERVWSGTVERQKLYRVLHSKPDPSEVLILSRCLFLGAWVLKLEGDSREHRVGEAL